EVVKVGGQGAIRRRLLDMGITPGTRILLIKTAPMGDPLEITLRGFNLSIRKEDARYIELKMDSPEEESND
ncbi:MAG: FeoA domain-containing protein, partial [Flexilinea sp.]|nr:FeoA domain-containing protein [Flexilinea sp.]